MAYDYRLGPVTGLAPGDSQAQQIYQDFLDNGINWAQYSPPSFQPPPEEEPPPAQDDGGTGEEGNPGGQDPDLGQGNPPPGGTGDNVGGPPNGGGDAGDTGDPNQNRDINAAYNEIGGSQVDFRPDAGGGGGNTGTPGNIGDLNEPGMLGGNAGRDGAYMDYDQPFWNAPFRGMSDAMLDRLGNYLRGKDGGTMSFKDWKTWVATIIPGGNTLRVISEKLIEWEQNRRAGERMKPDVSPEWFRDPDTGEVDQAAYAAFKKAINARTLDEVTVLINNLLKELGITPEEPGPSPAPPLAGAAPGPATGGGGGGGGGGGSVGGNPGGAYDGGGSTGLLGPTVGGTTPTGTTGVSNAGQSDFDLWLSNQYGTNYSGMNYSQYQTALNEYYRQMNEHGG